MNQKGISGLLLIIAGVIIIGVIYAAYLSFQKNNHYSSLQQNAINQKTEYDQENSAKNLNSTNSAILDNWKTYTNHKYRFELKYPDNVTVSESNNFVDFVVKPIGQMNVGGGVSARIKVENNLGNLSIKRFYKKISGYECDTESGGKCEEIIFNGYKALKVTDFVNLVDNVAIYIPQGQKVYILSTQKEQELPNQILATFKLQE